MPADPEIALLLIVGGALGVYAEFCLPGKVVPGVIGAVSILLGLAALWKFPLDWRGAILVVTSFLLLMSGRGRLFTIAGAMAMFLGSSILIDSRRTNARIHPAAAAAITIPFALITSFLFSTARRARRNKFPVDILKAQAKRKHDSVG